MYTSSHLGQYTLTLEVLSSSLIPTGKTFYLSHNTLGQAPNFPATYFSLIIANPLAVIINLAWINPYKSVAS